MLLTGRDALAVLAGFGAAAALYYLLEQRKHQRYLAKLSSAQREYLVGFAPERAAEPFLTWYTVAPDKSLNATNYTRGEFLTLALRGCRVLRAANVGAGDCHTHCFSCNTVGDLAFRLAAVLCGTTPVTINWQADSAEKVLYKVQITSSKLLLFDDETPADVLQLLAKDAPTLQSFNVGSLEQQPALSLHEACTPASALATADTKTRIVIFTSGTTGNPKGVQLAYSAYRCNRHTFEDFLHAGDGKRLLAVVVNPMHHTNSTAIVRARRRLPARPRPAHGPRTIRQPGSSARHICFLSLDTPSIHLPAPYAADRLGDAQAGGDGPSGATVHDPVLVHPRARGHSPHHLSAGNRRRADGSPE